MSYERPRPITCVRFWLIPEAGAGGELYLGWASCRVDGVDHDSINVLVKDDGRIGIDAPTVLYDEAGVEVMRYPELTAAEKELLEQVILSGIHDMALSGEWPH